MAICSRCGNEISGKFCTKCGAPAPNQKRCPTCGMNYTGNFCPRGCHTKNKKRLPTGLKIPLIVVGVVVAAFLCIVVVITIQAAKETFIDDPDASVPAQSEQADNSPEGKIRTAILRNIAGIYREDGFKLEIIPDGDKYVVILHTNTHSFDKQYKCGLFGIDLVNAVQSNKAEQSKMISRYEITFYQRGVKTYSAQFDNTKPAEGCTLIDSKGNKLPYASKEQLRKEQQAALEKSEAEEKEREKAKEEESRKAREKEFSDNQKVLDTILNEYDTNEVGADAKYKGKTVTFSGTVQSISKDIWDSPYVTLSNTSDIFALEARCYFRGAVEIEKISQLKPGDVIMVSGECEGKYIITVDFKNCTMK